MPAEVSHFGIQENSRKIGANIDRKHPTFGKTFSFSKNVPNFKNLTSPQWLCPSNPAEVSLDFPHLNPPEALYWLQRCLTLSVSFHCFIVTHQHKFNPFQFWIIWAPNNFCYGEGGPQRAATGASTCCVFVLVYLLVHVVVTSL